MRQWQCSGICKGRCGGWCRGCRQWVLGTRVKGTNVRECRCGGAYNGTLDNLLEKVELMLEELKAVIAWFAAHAEEFVYVNLVVPAPEV